MGRMGGGLLSIGNQIVYRPPSFIGLQPTPWMVRRMYRVDVYLRVRRAVMVEGMSIRETARTFGLHRDTVRKMLAYSVPPGYRRQSPLGKPKLKPFTGCSASSTWYCAGWRGGRPGWIWSCIPTCPGSG